MAAADATRICRGCTQSLALSSFPVRTNGRHYYQCKECVRLRAREWARRNVDRNRARVKAWRKADPARHLADNNRWRETNRARYRQYMRGWYAKHPEYWKVLKSKRRAAIRGNGGTHTAADLRALLENQGGICYYCPTVLRKYHVDHKTPLSRGGSNGPRNLVLACARCNLRKRTRTAAEFRALLTA